MLLLSIVVYEHAVEFQWADPIVEAVHLREIAVAKAPRQGSCHPEGLMFLKLYIHIK